jgi:cbb3-type cytochrome oxidase maturation protein
MVSPQDAARMSVIVLLIAAGGAVAAGFLCAFVWAVRAGQFDDMCTPAVRMLMDDAGHPPFPPRVESRQPSLSAHARGDRAGAGPPRLH